MSYLTHGVQQEDSPHTSGDRGVLSLVVRKDMLAALAGTDGDYAPLQVDATGALYVGGAGATTLGKAEDSVHANGDVGVMTLAVRNDTLAALAGTDGDYAPLQVNASGALYVTNMYSAKGIGKEESTAHTTTDVGVMMLGVRNDKSSPLDASNGDYVPIQTNHRGAVYVDPGFPLTAFGELSTAEKTPRLQTTFDTALDALQWEITSGGDSIAAQGYAYTTEGIAKVTTNGAAGGSAMIESREHAHYHAGQGLMIQLSGQFTTGVANNTQLIGYGDSSNGLFFGYNGTSFGVLMRSSASGSVVDTWTAQTSWNADTMDGSDGTTNPSAVNLDPTMSNVYFIQAQLHYMGRIRFFVAEATFTKPILVHTINFNNNTNTGITLRTASLPLHMSVENTSSNTDTVVVSTASMAVFIEGRQRIGDRKFAYTTTRGSINTEEHVLTLRIRSSVLGKTPHGQIYITSIETGTTANDPGLIRVYRNVKRFGASLTYTQPHLCSLFEVATNDTTITATATGTVSSSTGNPVYQCVIAGVVGTSNALAGCIVHIANYTRTILTSSGATNATITFAGIPLATGAVDGVTATIYNGELVYSQALGKDSSSNTLFSTDTLIHLSRPGDTITFTAYSGSVASIALAVSWIEQV